MATVNKSVASLRIFGHELIPENISACLGSRPSTSYRKGDVEQLYGGRELTRKTGAWLLNADDCEPENLDGQITDLLGRLTPNLEVWKQLSQQFEIDLYCGLFMEKTNEGFSLSPTTLLALAERHIEFGIDIYAPIREVSKSEQCPCHSGKLYGECCAPKDEV